MGDSDSENEGSQTNVNRLVIRPPGHTGDMELNNDEMIYIKKVREKVAFVVCFFLTKAGRLEPFS